MKKRSWNNVINGSSCERTISQHNIRQLLESEDTTVLHTQTTKKCGNTNTTVYSPRYQCYHTRWEKLYIQWCGAVVMINLLWEYILMWWWKIWMLKYDILYYRTIFHFIGWKNSTKINKKSNPLHRANWMHALRNKLGLKFRDLPSHPNRARLVS